MQCQCGSLCVSLTSTDSRSLLYAFGGNLMACIETDEQHINRSLCPTCSSKQGSRQKQNEEPLAHTRIPPTLFSPNLFPPKDFRCHRIIILLLIFVTLEHKNSLKCTFSKLRCVHHLKAALIIFTLMYGLDNIWESEGAKTSEY